jgi:hypothetical protein
MTSMDAAIAARLIITGPPLLIGWWFSKRAPVSKTA